MATELPDTPARQALFRCHPDQGADEVQCAEEILGSFARRAFRRPVQDADVQMAMDFYRLGREVFNRDVGAIAAALGQRTLRDLIEQ